MAKLTRNVLVLSSGLARRKGQSVGQNEVPERVWQGWIDEGIIVVDTPVIPPTPLEIEPKIEASPSPHGGDVSKSGDDSQLETLTDDQLKKMAKQLNIRSWQRMNRPKLLKRIEENA